MKKLKVKYLSIIVLTIIISLFATNVFASDLLDVTANGVGQTSGGNTGSTTPTTPTEIPQVQQPTFTTVNQTVYATANVNIKQSYSSTSTNIGQLAKDQSIKRVGVSSESGWSRVEMSNGTIGYIESQYLTTTSPTPTTVAPTNTNSSSYNSSNTATNNVPQTGLEDNTGMFVILGICVVSAIYAYKKIRDYNI